MSEKITPEAIAELHKRMDDNIYAKSLTVRKCRLAGILDAIEERDKRLAELEASLAEWESGSKECELLHVAMVDVSVSRKKIAELAHDKAVAERAFLKAINALAIMRGKGCCDEQYVASIGWECEEKAEKLNWWGRKIVKEHKHQKQGEQ